MPDRPTKLRLQTGELDSIKVKVSEYVKKTQQIKHKDWSMTDFGLVSSYKQMENKDIGEILMDIE